MKKGFINIFLYLFVPTIITSIFYPYLNINKLTYFIFISLPYFLLTIYYIYIYRKIFLKDLKNINKKNIIFTISLWIIGFLLMMLSNYIINYLIFDSGISANEAANRDLLFNHTITYSILMCLILPFLEEVCFRLEFKENIKKTTYFILISSFLFAIVHIINISSLLELIYLIPYLILGLTFSIIYQKTDCIYMNILAHILHNTLCVIAILYIF